MKGQSGLSIGDLAKATGTKVVTVRYYEQIGLMPVASRTAGNYRVYRNEHMRRLWFIRRCRDLGFTLDQIRELLRLTSEKEKECAEVDRITGQHLIEIERKIANLKHLAKELRRLNNCCQGKGIISECRISEPLSPSYKAGCLKMSHKGSFVRHRRAAGHMKLLL
jgi:DNA-binding transcriptional MerR regulator